MQARRVFLAMLALAALSAAPARAFEIQPYAKDAAQAAIASGKPVVIEVYASWCPICQSQASAVEAMKAEPAYKDLAFFRVDFDAQKEVVKALHSPRATLITYRGGKEVSRASWGATPEEVATVLMQAVK